jgi:hypothetical protein
MNLNKAEQAEHEKEETTWHLQIQSLQRLSDDLDHSCGLLDSGISMCLHRRIIFTRLLFKFVLWGCQRIRASLYQVHIPVA